MNSQTDKEAAVRKWFSMWLDKRDSGISDIFTDQAVYIESWGPEYRGAGKIKLWFEEWNTRGTVLKWEIDQFFHKSDQTVVHWHFQYQMDNELPNGFEGISLITWNDEAKIVSLQEFGCNEHRYDPYRDGPCPQFAPTKALWF